MGIAFRHTWPEKSKMYLGGTIVNNITFGKSKKSVSKVQVYQNNLWYDHKQNTILCPSNLLDYNDTKPMMRNRI